MLRTEEVNVKGYERVVFLVDAKAGMKGYVAIHDTSLGPAVGGCRVIEYQDQNLALKDALRLSRGMTYKGAAAGLNYGGGKTVIIANDIGRNRERVFESLGGFLNSLKGAYITGIDAGTSLEDMKLLKKYTRYVAGVPTARHHISDPSMVTAYGVYMGMKACIKEAFGLRDFAGLKVAVQGAGKVGRYLIERLGGEGAKIVLAEPREEVSTRMANEFGVDLVKPSQIYGVDCDIFSPCALGGLLNGHTIPRLKSRIVAGAANNQLLNSHAGDLLHKRGILYAPDYVINAGGLICVVMDMEKADVTRIMGKAAGIYDTLMEIFQVSRSEDLPTYLTSDRMAERRMIRARLELENRGRSQEVRGVGTNRKRIAARRGLGGTLPIHRG